MATHSSILAYKISWTGQPSSLYSPKGHDIAHMCSVNMIFYLLPPHTCISDSEKDINSIKYERMIYSESDLKFANQGFPWGIQRKIKIKFANQPTVQDYFYSWIGNGIFNADKISGKILFYYVCVIIFFGYKLMI